MSEGGSKGWREGVCECVSIHECASASVSERVSEWVGE